MTNTMLTWEPPLMRLENILVGDAYGLVRDA